MIIAFNTKTMDFAICYMPERNEEIGRAVTRAALDAARK